MLPYDSFSFDDCRFAPSMIFLYFFYFSTGELTLLSILIALPPAIGLLRVVFKLDLFIVDVGLFEVYSDLSLLAFGRAESLS